MPVRAISAGEELGLGRGAVAVGVGWAGEELDRATLEGVMAHTPAEAPLLVSTRDAGAAADELGAIAESSPAGTRELLVVEVPGVDIDAGSALGVIAGLAGAADVAWVGRGVRVGPQYLECLLAAAHSDTTVVSASALTEIAGLHHDPGQAAADDAARRVAAASTRAYPRVAAIDWRCALVRREALERLALGGDGGGPGSAPSVSERLLTLGLLHVVADDVWATAVGASAAADLQADHDDERGVLRRTLNVARAARRGLSVTIDARALGGSTVSGTQIYTVELVLALARSGRVRLRVVVPHDLSSFAARAFDSAPGIELLPYERATQGVELTDIVHRPQQVFTAADLALLRLLGQRIVVGQQDLIAYRDPAYHESAAVWWSYRRVTRLALAAADRVVFFSEHTRRDVIAEELLDAGRAEVTGIGGDAEAAGETGAAGEATAPSGAPGDGAFLACLGADYAHKNRPFAIALLEALNRRHGWSGRLVLAGASVPHGSSRGEERELLERWPALAERVTDVGPVDEAGRRWLYEHAAAVVYPSTYEGFGLVPFEAAAAGTPCLYAAQASLPELAGPEAATLVPWNPDASADAAIGLLADGPARQAHVSRLREAAAGKRWSEVTEHLLGAYERALRSPQRAGAPRAWQELERERYIATLGDDAEILKRSAVEYQEAFHDLNRRVGIALPLVDEGGLLSRDQQRGLMRIAARGLLRRLLLGPVGVLGRMGRDSPADRESPSE